MIENINFTFFTNISVDIYKTKNEALACLSKSGSKAIGKEKMAFKRQSVTIQNFLQMAMSGYTFCNLFDYDKNKLYWICGKNGKFFQTYPEYHIGKHKDAMKLCMKQDQYFYGSQTIFVDIDKTSFVNVGEYIQNLRFKPTCVYMSFSDNIEKHGIKSRRFRMVYVFDEILKKKDFLRLSQTINDYIVLDTSEPMDDDCGTRMSQYMNGVYGNNEYYETDIIYSNSDFPIIDYNQEENIQISDNMSFNQQPDVFNPTLIYDMNTLSYKDFMHLYSLQYRYVYRTENTEWIDGEYQMTDQNYLQLWFYREKVIDGQKRRKKLFRNACIRRLMYPYIDPNTLLFNLYVDRERFFDNSDGVITNEILIRKVKRAFELDFNELANSLSWVCNYWSENRPQFILHPDVSHNQALINSVAKKIRWKSLDERYDKNKSILENSKTIADYSLPTIYRYCGERWIDKNPNRVTEIDKRAAKKKAKEEKIALFKRLYDPSMSVRDTQDLMRQNGLELAVGTIQNWIKKYGQKNTIKCPTLELPEISFFDWSSYHWNC